MIHKLTRYGVAEAAVKLTVYFNNLSVNAVAWADLKFMGANYRDQPAGKGRPKRWFEWIQQFARNLLLIAEHGLEFLGTTLKLQSFSKSLFMMPESQDSGKERKTQSQKVE